MSSRLASPCTNGFLVPVIKYPQKQLKRRLVLRHDLRRDTVPDGGGAWWQEWRWLVTRHVQLGSRGDGEDRGSAVSQLSAFLCSPGPYLRDGVVHIQDSSFFPLHLNHSGYTLTDLPTRMSSGDSKSSHVNTND